MFQKFVNFCLLNFEGALFFANREYIKKALFIMHVFWCYYFPWWLLSGPKLELVT
jgi:hypothetical protein